MTTTHASTHAPKPVEASSKAAQQGQNTRNEKPADTDLFASLLSLVSDAHAALASPSAEGEATDAPQDDEPIDGTAQNPLAALLAWSTPSLQSASAASGTATAAAPAPTTPVVAEGTAREKGLDITGMARVDEPAAPSTTAQARAAVASRPAFSPLNPNTGTVANTTAALQRAPDGTATTPAMVWQRGAVSSTDALQQQQSAQFAQARATVALNERLGLTAVAEPGATPAGPREFAPAGLSGPGATATNSPTQDGGLTAATGTSAGDSSGGDASSSQTSADQGQGDGRHHAEAGAEAEGPTVSHWGTQHLRHASLRVGEGGADAIDIQLAVKGQEVQVAFQTDNAEARASLRESAGDALADLMQRSGIQLGSVSVGSQGQAHSDGSSARPTVRNIESIGRSGPAAETAAPAVRQPRTDGNRPLDVFA
ncbi:flagellar hook-length control protein FliK [Hydrogenophaga laconesensis]|uniref:Flagellar hook-length control protein-like C-terminal domain-containing protein n=1 Tax=Hydrogenophaga laconesensis TaxID=1805971 RepID=A0ABU1VA25_9BURK|nr:flagellar hook-length control protein FliK [Hydrogenophaga laconesensis]MDR7094321.1 hypothetical protein [Hydrogenophaga laconesensis]